MRYFILKGHEVVPAKDLLEWGRWFETANRVVEQTTVGTVLVSTVFIGLAPHFDAGFPPPIFETMIFGSSLDGDCRRWSTWEEAELGHATAVEDVKESLLPPLPPVQK